MRMITVVIVTETMVFAFVEGVTSPLQFKVMATEETVYETTTLEISAGFCDRYWSSKNYKSYKVLSAYEGLPECIILNAVILLVIILVFSILRKKAWNYGRLGLVRRMEERNLSESAGEYNVWAALFYGEDPFFNPDNTKHSVDKRLIRQDQGLFSWIPTIFRIKDEDIYKRCGPDAVQYLVFQKYLIAYLLVVAVISLTVALPLNFTQGDFEGSGHTFGRTTITNINPNSSMLWIHCALGLFLLCVAMAFMRHFTEHVHYYRFDVASKTLMIRKIPADKCFSHLMEKHFEEAYPECEIADIQFAYNVQLLIDLDLSRQTATSALISSQIAERETGERPKIMPYCCGALLCCKCCEVCGWKQVDAIDYYTEQLAMYQELCDVEKVNAFHEPLGIVFITFVDEFMAKRVKLDFRMTCRGRHQPMTSSVSRQLHVNNWIVEFAPSPDDIYWENLSASPVVWWTRAIIVNFGILLLVIFFTTPSVVLNQLNRIEAFRDANETESNYILQFIPTLLLVTTSALLPVVVSCSDIYIVGHYTRTALNHAVMAKTFIFLLIMVLVMPSLGFSSIGTMIEWFSSGKQNSRFRWNCIFVSTNSAFFVNYMISSALLGIGLDLLRLADLASYAFLWAIAKSDVERPMLRKLITTEFQYGTYYAWILSTFTVTMAYSIVCPLITVPGLLYQVLKYYVDRYNLCFAYKSSRIDNRIHETAINFVIISVFCLQLTILCFILLRADNVTGVNIFPVVAIAVLFFLFCLGSCLGKLRPPRPATSAKDYRKLPKSFEDSESKLPEVDGGRPSFLPTVLEGNDNEYDEEAYSPRSNLTYGTDERKSTIQAPHDVPRKLSTKMSDRKSRRKETATSISDARRQTASTEREARESQKRETTANTRDTAQLIGDSEHETK